MIIKFDGIDGCGKSTLCRALAETLSSSRYRVALVSEFASPVLYAAGSAEPVPVTTMQIREAVLDPAFDCDDVERQLLLHFLSRRKNRVEIPHLDTLHDYVIVDRSTLSNYAYAAAVNPRLAALSDLAVGDMEKADRIFWIDTPIDVCMERMSARLSDAVELKGRAYFERVRELYEKYAVENATTCTLDGRSEIPTLIEEVLAIVEGSSRNV
jgi:thymidylate kinase